MSRFGSPDGPWCKVEIMGHVEHIARALEVPLLDGKALRVCDEVEGSPIFYGLGAIFSLRWLTDEEGEKASAKRKAERAEDVKRAAHHEKMRAVREVIRETVGDLRLPLGNIETVVRATFPNLSDAEFAEALDGAWLTRIPGENGAPDLWWQDPDDCPF